MPGRSDWLSQFGLSLHCGDGGSGEQPNGLKTDNSSKMWRKCHVYRRIHGESAIFSKVDRASFRRLA